MKRKCSYYNLLYYLSPFVFTPLLLLFCSLLAELPGLKAYMYAILCIIGCLAAAGLALCSRSPHTHDYLMTFLIPLSVFAAMFLVGFLDQTETRSRFDAEHAINIAVQIPGLFLYLCMAVTTFVASHKKLRIQKRR